MSNETLEQAVVRLATSYRPLAETILREAIRMFADQGYARTSMRELALAAGCTKPALYYHFGSKEDLFRACVQGCMISMGPLLAEALAHGGTVRDRVGAFAEALFEALRCNPDQMRLVLSLQGRPDQSQPDIDFPQHHLRELALITTLFEEGLRTGELRPDLDLDEAALVLLGALHSRAFLALKGVPIPERATRRIVDLLFRGFASPVPHPSRS